MPFFLHFRSDFLIEALPETVPAGEQPKWPPITANDYLQERLREIKLVRRQAKSKRVFDSAAFVRRRHGRDTDLRDTTQ